MESNWIDINDRLPDPGEYVLVSFENECITTVDIGTYRIDADGNGAFYHCDDDVSYATFGVFVNAWMPLPKVYRRRARQNHDYQICKIRELGKEPEESNYWKNQKRV